MAVLTAAQLTAKARQTGRSSASASATTKTSLQNRPPRPPPQPRGPKVEPKAELKLEGEAVKTEDPNVTVQYLNLYSQAPNGFTYNAIRFKPPNGRPYDVLRNTPGPILLNRKLPKSSVVMSPDDAAAAKNIKWTPLKGLDGKIVYHADGTVVLSATIDGKEMTKAAYEARLAEKAAGEKKDDPAGAKGKGKKGNAFKKKTRQVFTASEEVRQLRKEERYPWLLEPANGDPSQDPWTGTMTNQNNDGIYAFFAISPSGEMRLIPTHRCYDFVKTRTVAASMTSEEAEARFQASRKNNSLAVQFNKRSIVKDEKGNTIMSAATRATLEALDPGSSSGRGGVRVKKEEDDFLALVRNSESEDVKGRSGDGADAFDEIDFDEQNADDEEGMQPDDMPIEEDEKETQDRIKREQIAANKTVDSHLDDDMDGPAEETLTREGKRMKRALGKVDAFYDSDDEDANPYASSEDEDDDLELVPPPQDTQPKPDTPPNSSRSNSVGPSSKTAKTSAKTALPASSMLKASTPAIPNAKASRPGSPVTVSGSALLAKRATSPAKRGGSSRAPTPRSGSPLAGGSRAGSPIMDETGGYTYTVPQPSTSYSATTPSYGATSSAPFPPVAGSAVKRKLDDTTPAGGLTSPGATPVPLKKVKKAKPVGSPASGATGGAPAYGPQGKIPEELVINFLRAHPGATSTDTIKYFAGWMQNSPANKLELGVIIKKVAQTEKLDGGKFSLRLKDGY